MKSIYSVIDTNARTSRALFSRLTLSAPCTLSTTCSGGMRGVLRSHVRTLCFTRCLDCKMLCLSPLMSPVGTIPICVCEREGALETYCLVSPGTSLSCIVSMAQDVLNDQVLWIMRASAASSSDIDEDEEEMSTTEELVRFDPVEEDTDTKDFALAMAKVAWDLKGEDLLLLHVAPVVYWTRYMIFVTVFSRPQLNAILGKIQKTALEEYDMRPSSTPSTKSSWELLDFGDCVIHVLTAEEREYYDLESFYAAAEEVYLPFDDVVSRSNVDWRSKM